MMVNKRDYFMEALIKSLRASTRAFPQVLLRGKGTISMSYSWLSIFPSPEPLSQGLIQRFLNLLAPDDFGAPILDRIRNKAGSDPAGQKCCGACA